MLTCGDHPPFLFSWIARQTSQMRNESAVSRGGPLIHRCCGITHLPRPATEPIRGAIEETMTEPPHRYRAGDRGVFHAPLSLRVFAGAYEVERPLPNSVDGPTYLIRRVRDGHERVAYERELAPVTAPTMGRAWRGTRRSTRRS